MMGYSYKTLFNQGADVIEVIIRDSTGKMIDKKMCNLADKEEVLRIIKGLRDKWGIEIESKKDFLSTDSEFLGL